MKTFLIHCKKLCIVPHILFWLISISVFIVVLFYTRDFRISETDFKTAASLLITICLLAISVYINLLWLIPVFFKKRRYLLFFLLQVGNITLFITLNYFISTLFEGSEHLHFITEVIAELILVSVFLLSSSLLQFTRDSLTLQDIELKMSEIERQKVEAELKALKAQVNPHFFFNTLNSLYSLSLDKSEKTPDMILKLSELMRYVIYEAREDMLPLQRQLDFIRSYIYLEELRAGPSLQVRYKVEGIPGEIMVAPLIFIPFVENAFKHAGRDQRQKPDIDIKFDLGVPGKIVFYSENNVDTAKPKRHEGIGLDNVRKSLQILFPGKYHLEMEEHGSRYRVKLIIELS